MKLNQVLAVEKVTKARVQSEIDGLYKAVQKPSLFEGFSKTYEPLSDDGDKLPSEQQRVQYKVRDILATIKARSAELFDSTAQKEWANCEAKADVSVDGKVVVADVPATYLLFLEKQLTDLHTITSKLPVLDPSQEWTWDTERGFFKTKVTTTQRSKKVAKPIVLYPATPEHPAQTQLISEDILAGYWQQERHSGAFTEDGRAAILAKIDVLLRAVKSARQTANQVEAEKRPVGEAVLSFIFG